MGFPGGQSAGTPGGRVVGVTLGCVVVVVPVALPIVVVVFGGFDPPPVGSRVCESLGVRRVDAVVVVVAGAAGVRSIGIMMRSMISW
jgi:hypothetical protein